MRFVETLPAAAPALALLRLGCASPAARRCRIRWRRGQANTATPRRCCAARRGATRPNAPQPPTAARLPPAGAAPQPASRARVPVDPRAQARLRRRAPRAARRPHRRSRARLQGRCASRTPSSAARTPTWALIYRQAGKLRRGGGGELEKAVQGEPAAAGVPQPARHHLPPAGRSSPRRATPTKRRSRSTPSYAAACSTSAS